MNYKEIYNSLIKRGVERVLPKGTYFEKHHIVPKCMEGTNLPENLVKLTAREHFIAHQLLVKIYPNEPKLVFAAKMMTVDTNGERVGNRMYEWLCIKYAAETSKLVKGRIVSPETRRKMSETTKLRMNTPESKAKVSVQSTGRKHTEESKLKIGAASKGMKRSVESTEKFIKSMTGFKHSEEGLRNVNAAAAKRRGIPMSEEFKAKMREGWKNRTEPRKRNPCSEETKQKIGNANRGKIRNPKGELDV